MAEQGLESRFIQLGALALMQDITVLLGCGSLVTSPCTHMTMAAGGGEGWDGVGGSPEMQMLRFTPRDSDSIDLKWAMRLMIHQ